MPSALRRLALVAPLLLAGCAAGQSQRDDGEFLSRDVLTLEQIETVRATNAYEAVERLKSHWLRPRGSSQLPPMPGGIQSQDTPVMAYIDDQRLGVVDQLRTIEIAAVSYIQYFPPAEATVRWGRGNAGGVIFVSTRPKDR